MNFEKKVDELITEQAKWKIKNGKNGVKRAREKIEKALMDSYIHGMEDLAKYLINYLKEFREIKKNEKRRNKA